MDILHGRDYYNEQLMGLRFKVGAFSFFQTNVEAVERMFTDALALIPSLEGKLVWDLYSGTGTLAQTVAPKAQEAIGVELSEESVAMARLNALQNGLSNCSFIAGDVLKVLDDMTALPDVIIVDPPRSGIHPKAMKKIVSYGVPYILYISCNPKTLIRNLPEAMEAGYRIESFRIYDNFPFTRHVECVVLMSRVEK
ncbi:MAG: methyltransferase domain-containing protein, partial [Candidatus Cloacimonetes bacterium]|nr:methyltransferase domain-containing protein [Candidatus Cloacimonadota bacterium]